MLRSTGTAVLLLLLAVISLHGCSSTEDKQEKHFQKAMEYVQANDPKAAIIEFRNAIQQDATFADARYQLGLLYLQQGDPKNAFHELVRASDLDPNNLDAALKSAELYLIGRQKGESRKLVERILSQDPQHAEALSLLANLELIEGNYNEALGALGKIGDKVNTSDRLLNTRGRIYAAQGQWDKAETDFQQAAQVGRDSFPNYLMLLQFYQNRQNADKALEILKTMVELFSDNPQTYLLLAGYHRSQGNIEKVEESLLNSVKHAPDQASYRMRLAEFYMSTEQVDKAEAALLEADTQIPSDQDIKAALAMIYFDKEDYEKARQFLDTVLHAQSDHNGGRLLQARFFLKERKVTDAFDILNKLNQDFPRWADPFYYLGIAHLARGETELAAHAVGTAIGLNNNNFRYHLLMAQVFLIEGQFQNAKNEATASLKLNPRNLRAALIMVKAMIGGKEYGPAKKLLVDLDQQVPNNQDILSSLAIAHLGSGEHEQAEAVLNRLLDVAPGNERAVGLLISLKFRDKPAEALTFLAQEIQKSPQSGGLYLMLGEQYVRQELYDKALNAFDKARELEPDSSRAYSATGRLLNTLGQTDEAMAIYEEMIVRQPKAIAGYMAIGAILQANGKTEDAKKRFETVLELEPGHAAAANNLAWILAEEPDGDLGEALRFAMMAKQAHPDEPHIADTLGWIYYQRKAYMLAIPQFEMALNGLPGDPVVTYHLALALKEGGDKERAIGVLEKLLSRDDPFSEREKATQLLNELRNNPAKGS